MLTDGTHLSSGPLYSARYGRRVYEGAEMLPQLEPANLWYCRHTMSAAMALLVAENLPESGLRCVCQCAVQPLDRERLDWIAELTPEALARTKCQCVLAPTQEDGLCDECRVWCMVTDGTRVYNATTGMDAATCRTVTRGFAHPDDPGLELAGILVDIADGSTE